MQRSSFSSEAATNKGSMTSHGTNTYKRKKLCHILQTHQWTDCEFIIEGEKIQAHKLILVCNSPVFESMFYGKLARNDPIIIDDCNIEDFKCLLNYCYTDSVNLTSIPQAWNVIYLSKKYFIEGLETCCEKYISKNLSITTLLMTYEQSEIFGLNSLKELAFKEICHFFKEVFFYTTYHVNIETLTQFLQDKPTSVFPYLFLGAVRWALVECEENNLESNFINVWKILEENNLTKILETYNYEQYEFVKIFDSGAMNSEDEEMIRIGAEIYHDRLNIKKLHLLYNIDDEETLQPELTINKYLATEKQAVYRTPPQKIRERLRIRHPLKISHQLTVDKDCCLTGVIVSKYSESLTSTCEMFVQLTEEGRNQQVQKSRSEQRETVGFENQWRFNFNEMIVLRPGKNYTLNVMYFPSEENELLIHGFQQSLSARGVNFKIEDSSYAVLTGLCFYPL